MVPIAQAHGPTIQEGGLIVGQTIQMQHQDKMKLLLLQEKYFEASQNCVGILQHLSSNRQALDCARGCHYH